jgi:Bifunctional DNA primase/polymerase, N-terminal
VSRRSGREEAGHRYADAGWHVFPAEPGGKRPATEHGFLDGTTDHRQIQNWWRSEPRFNLAIATGAPGPDVLDVDKHQDGSGFGAFNRLKREGLVREPMAIIRTPSGGFHAYYQGTNQRNGHIPGEYVDFRSQGGYVVANPSRIAGKTYEVVKHQPSADTFDWAAAKGLLAPEPERQPYKPPERTADGPRDVGHLASWLATQPEGNRNHGLFWAANRAIEAGDVATLDSLAAAARAAGLGDREIDRTITSAQKTAGRGTGQRHFEHSPAAVSAPRALDLQAEAEAGALAPTRKRTHHGASPPGGSLIPSQPMETRT